MTDILYESYYGVSSLGNDQLYHHGIKGQKWGVRRYQNPDGTYTQAGRLRYQVGTAEGQKKGIIERTKIRASGFGQHVGGTIKAVGQAKGLGNKVGEAIGYRAMARNARIEQSVQERLKNASRTNLGKRLHETSEVNQHHWEDYAKDMHTKSTGRKVLEQFVPVRALSVPVEKLSGRQTTVGRQYLDRLVTGGWGGVSLDVAYGVSKKFGSGKLAKGITDTFDVKSPHHINSSDAPVKTSATKKQVDSNRDTKMKDSSKKQTDDDYDTQVKNYYKKNKKSLLDDAAKKDTYDMEFLERYQPEKDTKKKRLAEYRKYIDDPVRYDYRGR